MLCQVVGHDLIELSLSDVTELQMFYLDSLARVSDLIHLRLHLVHVTLQPLLALLVGEFNLFQAPCQLFFLLLLCLVCLIQLF